jgi:hypothetical protein
MSWMLKRLGQLICGLNGHTNVYHFERNRLSLCCLNCGHQTEGWAIRSDADPASAAGRFARARAIRPRLSFAHRPGGTGPAAT